MAGMVSQSEASGGRQPPVWLRKVVVLRCFEQGAHAPRSPKRPHSFIPCCGAAPFLPLLPLLPPPEASFGPLPPSPSPPLPLGPPLPPSSRVLVLSSGARSTFGLRTTS